MYLPNNQHLHQQLNHLAHPVVNLLVFLRIILLVSRLMNLQDSLQVNRPFLPQINQQVNQVVDHPCSPLTLLVVNQYHYQLDNHLDILPVNLLDNPLKSRVLNLLDTPHHNLVNNR